MVGLTGQVEPAISSAMSTPKQGRLFARIADELGQRISAGDYAIGERLPSERLLAQEFGVSRPTIREALFALELAGHVEVRVGAGVFTRARSDEAAKRDTDMGPFEMLEARRAIEGEACALAALRISPGQLAELEEIIGEIDVTSHGDVVRAELADRRFHETIASATENAAMAGAVEMLWEARAQSRECQLMTAKAQAAGVVPSVEEHRAILTAIRSGDPSAARKAMHKHLTRVLDSVMLATEVDEVEQARARVTEKRRKFAISA